MNRSKLKNIRFPKYNSFDLGLEWVSRENLFHFITFVIIFVIVFVILYNIKPSMIMEYPYVEVKSANISYCYGKCDKKQELDQQTIQKAIINEEAKISVFYLFLITSIISFAIFVIKFFFGKYLC